MTVNFKTLLSFTTTVEARSLADAAQQLGLAQAAVIQDIAYLEKHFRQRLLDRSRSAVTVTPAGNGLYRHACLFLKQLEQSELDLASPNGEERVSGNVSLGLATYSSASVLSTPLLQSVRQRHPEVNLFVNDNFGTVLSERVMTGRLDMAVIYAPGPLQGVRLQPLVSEDLCLVLPADIELPGPASGDVALASLVDVDLLLPSRSHHLRRIVDDEFSKLGMTPRIIAEIESADTLHQAIEAGLGATILPSAMAPVSTPQLRLRVRRIVEPALRATLLLCVPDHLPMSEQAKAVLDILGAEIEELFSARPFAAAPGGA